MSEKKRVIVLEDLALEGMERLRGEGLEVENGTRWDERQLLRRMPGCHGLVVGPAAAVTAEVLRAGAELQVVGRTGPVAVNVDLAEATRRGVVVVTTPQSNAISSAEQALAMLLASARDLAGVDHDLRAGRWEQATWAGSSVEVRGRTLGIIGLAGAGALVAESARALGMSVLMCDVRSEASRPADSASETTSDADEVYRTADFLLVDLPDAAESAGYVGVDAFARMKDGVRVLSLAPGGVVDSAAWVCAIESGKVAASALAVRQSDLAARDPLLAREDVLLVPQLEESTVDARLRAGLMVAEQVAAVLRGEFASNAVNVPLTLVDDAAELMPYLGLCAQLGRLVVGLAGGAGKELEITYGGSFAYFDTRILTLGVLEGVLAGQGEGPVNYVNAASLAEARGLSAKETTQSVLPDFPRLITVSATGPRGPVTVSGTSLGPEHKSRLVRVFGEDIDIDPAPHMLFLRYVDAPGVGGAVGTMLGEWRVNIGHMSVGRGTSEREAVMALTLDEPLDETQLDQLVEHCGLSFGAGVEL
jgi:D-3-phosphoglycerate dehydrogenase / 2-oxoglutarate reductase